MKILRSIGLLSALLTAAPVSVQADDATAFCGRALGEPAALLGDISKATGMKEIHRGPEYVAYQDEASQAVFTFTTEGAGPAHPAVVCRKPVKDGDNITLQMVIICKGDDNACQRLESDFKLLNAQMEAAIRSQSGQTGGQK